MLSLLTVSRGNTLQFNFRDEATLLHRLGQMHCLHLAQRIVLIALSSFPASTFSHDCCGLMLLLVIQLADRGRPCKFLSAVTVWVLSPAIIQLRTEWKKRRRLQASCPWASGAHALGRRQLCSIRVERLPRFRDSVEGESSRASVPRYLPKSSQIFSTDNRVRILTSSSHTPY